MASAHPVQEDQAEAVIISGPRKGEFIRVSEAEPVLTPEESAMLDSVIESAWRLADTTRAAAKEADLILQEIRCQEAP